MNQLNAQINTLQATLDNPHRLYFSWWSLVSILNTENPMEAKNNLIEFASNISKKQIIWHELCEAINPNDPKQSKENFINFIQKNVLDGGM